MLAFFAKKHFRAPNFQNVEPYIQSTKRSLLRPVAQSRFSSKIKRNPNIPSNILNKSRFTHNRHTWSILEIKNFQAKSSEMPARHATRRQSFIGQKNFPRRRGAPQFLFRGRCLMGPVVDQYIHIARLCNLTEHAPSFHMGVAKLALSCFFVT